MSSISGLTVLTLGLGRINLLKENMIQAELPFCKQKNSFTRGTKQPSEFAAVSCQSLSQSFAMKICASSLHRAAQAFEETTHWHALQCCPVTRWKKQGGSRSPETKRAAASIDPWAEDATFLFVGWKSPRSLLCITDISSVSACATSKATG